MGEGTSVAEFWLRLSLILTLSLALFCVWESDLNADLVSSTENYKRHCKQVVMWINTKFGKSQAHVKISSLAFASETPPSKSHSMKYQRHLLCRNFSLPIPLGKSLP